MLFVVCLYFCESQSVKSICHHSCSECLSDSYSECTQCKNDRVLLLIDGDKSGICTCPVKGFEIDLYFLKLEKNQFYEDGEHGCRELESSDDLLLLLL